MEHEIQKEILLKLIHHPGLIFTELWDKKYDSNKFSYHLGCLEGKNLIVKENGKYFLSDEGRKLSAFIEGDTGKKTAMPNLVVALIIEKDGKMLVQKRLKEPFYGYWGLISGKINFGWNIEECACRDLLEETGLEAERSTIIGVKQDKTYEKGALLFHHFIFFVRLDDIKGELKEKTHKAENSWMTLEEFQQQERLPDPWMEDVLNSKEFLILETERILDNGKFVSCEVKKNEKIPRQ